MTKNYEEWEKELTAKQRAFVREYLIDLNATQAATRAGFSARSAYSQGQRLLSHPEVERAISAAMKLREERTGITADRVLKELAKIGFADIRKAVKWKSHLINEEENPDGGDVLIIKTIVTNNVELVSSEEIDDETAAAIAEISQNTTGGLKIKLHDKRAALMDIGRHLGMFKEKIELTGKDGGPLQTVDLTNVSEEQLAALEAFFGPLAESGDNDAGNPGGKSEATG